MAGKLRFTVSSVVALFWMALVARPQVSVADSIWTVYDMSNSPLPSNLVSSIYFDNSGNQYIGTSGGGLALVRDSAWTVWNQSNTGVPIDVARVVEGDTCGNLWVGAASGDLGFFPYGFGVARLGGSDSVWAMYNSGLEVNRIVTGIVVHGQTRFVSTYGGGMTVYDSLGWTRYRYSSRTEFSYADSQQHSFNVPPGTYIPSDLITAIDIDRSGGALWIATADAGAVRLEGNVWTTYNSGNSGLPSNQLLAIRVDPHNGNVYFGTQGFGMAVLSDTVWTVFDTGNSPLPNGYVHTIEVRPGDGEVWLGTGYGVWVLQTDSTWRSYIPPDNNFIWGQFYSDIAFDSSGAAWVAAYGGGVAWLTLGQPPPPPDSLDFEVRKLKVSIHRNPHANKVKAKINVFNAPQLTVEDTVSMLLDSQFGQLYSLRIPFADFERRDGDDDDDDGAGFEYRYREHHLDVRLRVDGQNPELMEVKINDNEAQLDQDSFDDLLTVVLVLGNLRGSQVVLLRHGDDDDDDGSESGGEYWFEEEETPGDEGNVTAVDRERQPREIGLEVSNYPNPFNATTTISFALEREAVAKLAVYDLLGRLVEEVDFGWLTVGEHRFRWPGDNAAKLKSGVYYYRLSVGEKSAAGKLLYLK